MKTYQENISIVESQWFEILFSYTREKFSASPLPSHDHFHHQRVWNYAKQLIRALAGRNIHYTTGELEKIIIAVFFHDVGMIITREEQHGAESRKLCRQFFDLSPFPAPKELENILEMIEKHDDKEYSSVPELSIKPSPAVILNIADDLDAYGNIGVYRYIEIYHFRGIPVPELTERIIPNLETRFQHFIRYMLPYAGLLQFHRGRYETTKNFFLNLKEELILETPQSPVFQLIVDILIRLSDFPSLQLSDSLKKLIPRKSEDRIQTFFNDFLEELDYPIQRDFI